MADDTDQPRPTPPAGNRLRHGTIGGDPRKAPRCGAKTRGARGGRPCRQPAMRSGRCRMHGGLSRGPVTEAGRARAAAAGLKHGAYSRESIELRAALHRSRAEAEELIAKLLAEADADPKTGAENV